MVIINPYRFAAAGLVPWLTQANQNDNFSASAAQYVSQSFTNSTGGSILLAEIDLEVKGTSSTATGFVEWRTAQNGGGSLLGTTNSVVSANGVYAVATYILAVHISVANAAQIFACFKTSDFGADVRCQSGTPVPGETAYQGGSSFPTYALKYATRREP